MKYITIIAVFWSACAGAEGPIPAGPMLDIRVAPLTLPGVGDARYRLTVKNGAQDLVWTAEVRADQYGDGQGSLAYVGPCDADPAVANNQVELEILDLYDLDNAPLPADSWRNPAPAGSPLVQQVVCAENADRPVEFNLTIARSANQGFFDIGVEFSDIFCSAKLDCEGPSGDPLKLLFNPDAAGGEARDTTVVMGFACTAGPALPGASAPEPTWLHLTDIEVECDGQPPIWYDPSGPQGNNGPRGVGTPPTLFQTAEYRGAEELPGIDKCYWNTALGLSLGANARNCRLTAHGTASNASFGQSGASPTGATYPYIRWNVTLTDANGALVCEQHALDGVPVGVATQYTPRTGGAFQHEWKCGGEDVVTSPKTLCDGDVEGSSDSAAVYATPDGVSVDVAGVRTRSYRLPAGLTLGADPTCCVNPCCD